MNSSSISLNNIPTLHHNLIQKKISICNPQKTIFKLVARSLFKSDEELNTSNDENAPVRSTNKDSFKSLSSKISSMVSSYSTNILTKFEYPPLPLSVDPNHVLTDNFTPVGETAPTECLVIEGEISPSLNRAYIRNGPNPQYMPVGPYHLWSGDGMLHSIRLLNGRAIYCSRFVKTCKYELEQAKGCPLIPNVISGFYGLNDLCNCFKLLGTTIMEQVNMVDAFGVANTSLSFFHGKLFALADGGRPYAIQLTQEGDLVTLREHKFGINAPINMTAHPKVDTETKEVFAFQLHIKYPYLAFFRSGPNGSDWEKVPILSMNHICLIHDFAITKQNAIFFDTQWVISLFNLLKCKGIPVNYEPTKVSRIGILPRYATSDSGMRWFEAPGLNAFHIVNSWEEGDQIVIITPTISSPDNIMYEIDQKHSLLEKITVDTKTGEISRKNLSELCLEFGSINPKFHGKKNRYVYMGIHGGRLRVAGVVKIDLELECEVTTRYFGFDCFGGEISFVPKCDTNGSQCDEDDGFLVTYMHNETTDESHFVVLDAKSLEILCKVKLPGRVPYGLHGIFLNEEQVKFNLKNRM